MTRPGSIALIDISALFKQNYHAMPGAEPTAAARKTLQDVSDLRLDRTIICIDSPPYKRKDIYPEYKANRPTPEPSEAAQRKWLYAELVRAGYQIARVPGYEADDVIATLARIYGEICHDVRIVARDKDAAQCLSANVTQWIPPIGERRGETRDVDGVVKKFGVLPDKMTLFQALMGDDSDNVPGVPGIGPKRGAELVNKYRTLEGLAAAMADAASSKAGGSLGLLAKHWSAFQLSLSLVTLDTNVPIDAEALLQKLEPEALQRPDDLKVELPNFMSNATPPHDDDIPIPTVQDRGPIIGADPKAAEFLKGFPAEVDRLRTAAEAEHDAQRKAAQVEQQYDRQRVSDAEFDPISRAPGAKASAPVQPPPARPAPLKAEPRPLAKTSAPEAVPTTALSRSAWGTTTADLQPMDLDAVNNLAQVLFKGGLYQQYANAYQVFSVIVRGRELGLGTTTALAMHHIIEGKPVAHADLIRALAERDPNFVYLMPIEIGRDRCVWEGKHLLQPRPVKFEYTIEDARVAGLLNPSRKYNTPSKWLSRPQDFLMKTAGSKLARLLWPGATMGMYCAEELGGESTEDQEAA